MGRTMQAMSPVFWGDEPVMADDPFDEPPYQVDDKFYCNACKAYSKEFYPSAIARQMRECRPCKNNKRKSRVQSHLSKLRSRLFKAFNRRGFKGHRTVFKNKSSLVELIRDRGLLVKDVTAIIPPKDENEVSNMGAYGFILRSKQISYKVEPKTAI